MTTTLARRLAVPLLLVLAPAPALAEVDDVTLVAADDLRPGQFVWQPHRAPAGPVEIVVSVPNQMIYVFRDGMPIGASTVSTGKRGHETPAGSYTILQKRVDHRSNLYGNAPMPYMQRLTWGGIAIHAGSNPGRAASHGCIRVPHAFAKHLFEATSLGASVVVTDAAPLSASEAAIYTVPAVPFDPSLSPYDDMVSYTASRDTGIAL